MVVPGTPYRLTESGTNSVVSLMVGMFALLLRGGVLALLVYSWHIPAGLAIFPAIAATAVVNYLGSAFYVFPITNNPPSLDTRWRIASVGVVVFILLLRLILLGTSTINSG